MLVLRKRKKGLVGDLVAPTEVDELEVGLGRGTKGFHNLICDPNALS
jgi:hypothetical protein